jgi:DNA-binding SARP family transcriptional activator
VDFAILGPLEVRSGAGTVPLNAPKQRALLLRLLVDPGRVVQTERLIEDLWQGAPPPGALSSLRAYVSNVRRVLATQAGVDVQATPLITQATGYTLQIDPSSIDAQRFEDLLGSARRALGGGAPEVALGTLDEALRLWRGPALVDVADADFARPTITRLEELHRIAQEERFAALLAAGQHDAAIVDLERFTAAEPLRERPRQQLALALHRAGRTPDALQVHREFRDTLVDELGLDPSEEFEELAARMLRRDPGLELLRPPTAGAPPAHPKGASGAHPRPPRPTGTAALLGREPERELITAAIDGLSRGRGSLLFFGGEPGIGKTTLLDEVARQGAAVAAVHWGRCPETDGAPAFWPWTRMLGSVVAALDDDQLATSAEGLAALAHLVPELTRRLGVQPPTHGDDLHAARFELFDETSTFLQRVAQDGLVLLLDDLHWADEPSLELLRFLAPHLDDTPLLLAATYRDAPAERTPALDTTLAAVVRQATAADLHLTGLGPHHVAEVVATTLGRDPDDELVATLHERTDGNPFFVTQLARLLDEAGTETPASAIPTGVRHVIVRRLQLLPTETQGLLELAAVVGRSFDAAVVARAADAPLATVLDALDEGFAHGLVRPEGGSVRRFRFVHALIRETLHDGLSPATTARSHAAVAGALEAGGGQNAQEIAEHYWLAADLAPEGRTIRWSLAAADEALEVLAYEQAEHHLRRALGLLDGGEDLTTELAVRGRLVSLLTSSVGWSVPEIAGIAGRVEGLADEHGLQPEMLPLWHLLWTCRTTRGDIAGGLALAKALHSRADQLGDDLHRAMALSMWGYCELHLGGDGPANLDRIVTARDQLDLLPDAHLAATPEHLGSTVRLAATVATGLIGDREATLAEAEATIAYAARLGRPFPLVAAYLFAGWGAAAVGAPEEGAAWTTTGLELCERYRFRQATMLITPFAGWAQARLGADPVAQAARISAALDAIVEVGHVHGLPQWLGLLADVHLLAGEVEEARARVSEARRVVETTGERVQLTQLDALQARIDALAAGDPGTVDPRPSPRRVTA